MWDNVGEERHGIRVGLMNASAETCMRDNALNQERQRSQQRSHELCRHVESAGITPRQGVWYGAGVVWVGGRGWLLLS